MRIGDARDPIDALYGEHDEALEQLSLLGDAARSLAAGGDIGRAMDDLDRAVGFLDREIRAHNEWEETHLFPRLERYTGPGGPCGVMRSEHRQLWDLYGSLGPLRDKQRGGKATAAERERLGSVAASIVDLLSAHIAKENEILFPMAESVIPPAGRQALGQAFASAGTDPGAEGRLAALAAALGA